MLEEADCEVACTGETDVCRVLRPDRENGSADESGRRWNEMPTGAREAADDIYRTRIRRRQR